MCRGRRWSICTFDLAIRPRPPRGVVLFAPCSFNSLNQPHTASPTTCRCPWWPSNRARHSCYRRPVGESATAGSPCGAGIAPDLGPVRVTVVPPVDAGEGPRLAPSSHYLFKAVRLCRPHNIAKGDRATVGPPLRCRRARQEFHGSPTPCPGLGARVEPLGSGDRCHRRDLGRRSADPACRCPRRRRFGKAVSIGHLQIRPGRIVTVTAQDVTVGNPPDWTGEPLARLPSLRVQIDAWDYLRHGKRWAFPRRG